MVTCLDGIAAIAGDDDVAVVGKYRMVAECGDPLAAVTADGDGAVVYDRRVISAGDDTSIVVSVPQDDAGPIRMMPDALLTSAIPLPSAAMPTSEAVAP